MTISHTTDTEARTLALLLAQFQDKPRIRALMSVIAAQIQALEDAHDQLLNDRTIEAATDATLDMIGRIVGEGRAGLDDDAYRARIRVRLLINRSNAKHGEILRAVSLFEGLEDDAEIVELAEVFPAGMRLTYNGEPSTSVGEITILLRRMKGAGIRLDYIYDTTAVEDVFEFSSSISPTVTILVHAPALTSIATGPDGDWTTTEASSNFDDVFGVAGSFIGVGTSGTVRTTPDGEDWTTETFGVSTAIIALAGSPYFLVAVGSNGMIRSSLDAATWTARTSGTVETLEGVCNGNGLFVVVGSGGTILSAAEYDVSTWFPETSGVAVELFAVCHGNDGFVTVGESGTILSSPNGSAWTSRTSGVSDFLFGVIYMSNVDLYVAFGDGASGGTILTSPTMVTWTARTSGLVGAVRIIDGVYHDGTAYLLDKAGNILTSTNGTSWTVHTGLPSSSSYRAISVQPTRVVTTQGFDHEDDPIYGGELSGVVVI